MSAMQRRKGAGYEREVCADLKDSLGLVVSRNLGQARDSGNDVDVGKFRLECKRRRRIAMEAWLRQCETGTKPGQVPVVVCRADGGEGMVLMRWRDFLPMLGNELDDAAMKVEARRMGPRP